MPSFVAHLLIAKGVIPILSIPNVQQNQNYFLLGSLAPDLPYYQKAFGTAIGTFFEEKFNPDSPGFYLGEGDYFHSRTPNLFPMKMIETIRKDKDSNTQARKLSFALGYLTHVAADQHIHPFVEQYAGAFFVSGVNRKKHRTLEVYQDILLYENVTGKKFFDEDFPPWFDVGPPRKEEEIQTIGPDGELITEKRLLGKIFTYDWFRSFIQRAFLETYSSIIDGDEMEKWTKGFNWIFKFLESVGPYHDAYKNIEEDSEQAKEFKEMFYGGETNYLVKCFEPAKELSKKYISVANVFLNSSHISDKERNEFLSLIPDADLVSPLADI